MNTMECLKDIIGIIGPDCPCPLVGIPPEDIEKMRASKSGLFADDIDGGVTLESAKTVSDCKNYVEIMLDAKRVAEQRVNDDIVSGLSDQYSSNKQKYMGLLGEALFSPSIINLGGDYAGLKIIPRSTDGVVKIKTMNVMLNTSGNYDISIIRTYKGAQQGTQIALFPQTPVLGNVVTGVNIGAGIDLPLMFQGAAVEYYILYNRNGALPRQNKILCNCGTQTQLVSQFVSIYGVSVPSLDALNLDSADSTFANGFSLNVEIKCDQGSFICREYDENEAISVTMAYAAMYKTKELIIEKMLNTTKVNRNSLAAKEELWGKRNHYRKEYNDRINYIIKAADVSGTDCFVCKQRSNDISVVGIVV